MTKDSLSFGVSEERLRQLKKNLVAWGAIALIAFGVGIYAASQFYVTVREYKQVKERLCAEVIRADGRREDFGCQESTQKLTPKQHSSAKKLIDLYAWLTPAEAYALIVNAGENALVDAFQNTFEPENFKFHAIGTGSTAVAETDTALVTELTTQYNPDNTRATGSLGEGSATNIYRTVGTNTVDATVTIAEFALLSQAATGGGTMLTRILISPTIGLASGDSLQTTYDLTIE